ncbi:hypothetical protein VP01_4848g1, partial [Puccinia sorghi]
IFTTREHLRKKDKLGPVKGVLQLQDEKLPGKFNRRGIVPRLLSGNWADASESPEVPIGLSRGESGIKPEGNESSERVGSGHAQKMGAVDRQGDITFYFRKMEPSPGEGTTNRGEQTDGGE